jgi:hypothetical protein
MEFGCNSAAVVNDMNIQFNSFDVEYAILCDDVRREDNGKLIFIGVYSHALTLQVFPATLSLQLVIGVMPKRKGNVSIEVRGLLDGALSVGMTGSISLGGTTIEPVAIPPLPFAIPHAGKLKFEMREGASSEWKIVLEAEAQLIAP